MGDFNIDLILRVMGDFNIDLILLELKKNKINSSNSAICFILPT